MKRIVVGLLTICLLGSLTVWAEEHPKTEKAVKKEVALQEITVTGKLSKDAKGGFCVTEADGTMVKVAAAKAAKAGETAAVTLADLEKLDGKDVKLVGKGTSKTSKDGKKTSVIKVVTSIEEAAASAAAPAAAKEAK